MHISFGTDRPLKIFLIEDSLMDVNLFKIALSRRNSTSELTTFINGEEALRHLHEKIAEGRGPDATILDLNLPGMDGIEVLEECQNDPGLKSMPVVVFTSTPSPREIDRCYSMGAAKVVAKPGDLQPYLGAVQGIEDCLRKNVQTGENLGKCIEQQT